MNDQNGPDPLNLRGYGGMLNSLNRGVFEKTVGGKGKKISIPLKKRPTKICKVCLQPFDEVVCPEDTEMKPSECERCQGMFKDGYTAVVSGTQCVFVRSGRFKDLAGQVIFISEANMEKIISEYGVTSIKREGAEDAS